MASASSRCPLPATPATPTIWEAPHLYIHIPDRLDASVAGGGESGDGQDRRPGFYPGPVGNRQVPPHHHPRQPGRVRLGDFHRPHHPSVPEHAHTRSDTSITSSSLCETKMIARPSSAKARMVANRLRAS